MKRSRDLIVAFLIKARPLYPGKFQVDFSEFNFKLFFPYYSEELAEAGIVWYSNSYQKAIAEYYGIELSKEEYMTILTYKQLMNKLHEQVESRLELEEVFDPKIPDGWQKKFNIDFGNINTEFKLNGNTVSVFFDELDNNTVEVGFDVNGVSTGRTLRGFNTVLLFSNLLWLIAEFANVHGQVNRFKIISPNNEDDKFSIYRKIADRPEVRQFLIRHKLKTAVIGKELYVERI